MKKYYHILFLLLLPGTLFSQTGFFNGFIVRLKGDTLHGLVYLSTDRNNMKRCVFKRFELAMPVTYKAGQLKAYGITDKRLYESTLKNGKWEFVEILVKGRYSLISERGKYKIEKDGETAAKANNESVKELAGKFPGMVNTDSVKIKEKSLVHFIDRINKISGSSSEICKQSPSLSSFLDYTLLQNQFEIGILAGGNLDISSQLSAPDNDTYLPLVKSKFNSYSSFTLGAYCAYQMIRHPRLALVSDVLYHKKSLHGYAYDSNSQTWNDAFIDITNVTASLMLRCYFGDAPTRMYMQVGGIFSVYQKGTIQQYTDYQVGNAITSDQSNHAFKSDSYGPRLGIGIEKRIHARKFFIQLEGKYGISQTGFLTSDNLWSQRKYCFILNPTNTNNRRY